MSIDLPLIWAGVIAFGIFMYVVMDGFDLGIGILYPFFRDKDERDAMMNTVAPIWDGNETWLVLGGAGLFAALGASAMAYLAVPLLDRKHDRVGLLVLWKFDDSIRKEIVQAMNLNNSILPVFIIADTFNRVVFVSQGYTIGLGEQLMKVVHGL